jgi:hypothetical protein
MQHCQLSLFVAYNIKTTGMNPKASFEVHTLRFAGLFNLPIPMRFAFRIGVSQIQH